MNSSNIYDTIKTKRFRDFSDIIFANIKDQEAIEDRIIRNEPLIDTVINCLESHYGSKLTVDQLRIYARCASKIINKKIDRLANRNRMALLCWYSENWNEIQPHLNEFLPMDKNPTRPSSISFSKISNQIDPSDFHQLLNYH